RLQAGIAEAKAGNQALARRYFLDAAREDSSNELAWLWLASVTESAHEAVGHFLQVMQINPANERARTGILAARMKAAELEVRAGNKERARRYLLDVTEKEPDHETGWLRLAELAESPPEAISHLERFLQFHPENHRAREAIARYRARMAA